jgi:rhamnulokinase
MHPVLVAVDLGAESCRVSLLQWRGQTPNIELVHRFPNSPVQRSTGIHWDLNTILAGVVEGIRKCAEQASGEIAAIGVDGWAVDYVRLRKDRVPAADPYCYRDERTMAAEEQVHRIIPPDQLYQLTGIQLLRLNSVYQLFADNDQGSPWVNLPEFVTHYLGGERVAEYTNATHTGLVRLGSHDWCGEIFEALRLEIAAAPRIVQTGTTIGTLDARFHKTPFLRRTQLIVPACHDTASAIAGIPADGDDWAFISSGTWSLVGTTLPQPCVSDEARRKNFTNLGGAGNQICFLKNVNGMWLLRQCIDEWEKSGHRYDLTDLLRSCSGLPAPARLLGVDEPELMLPGNMPQRIQQQLGSNRALDPVSVVNVVLHSLAARYAEVILDVAAITGKTIRRLYIVGGGSQNAVLNRLTAERTSLEIFVGPTECTTAGNFAVQLAAVDGAFAGVLSKDAIAQWAVRLSAAPQPLSLRHSSRN